MNAATRSAAGCVADGGALPADEVDLRAACAAGLLAQAGESATGARRRAGDAARSADMAPPACVARAVAAPIARLRDPLRSGFGAAAETRHAGRALSGALRQAEARRRPAER